MGWSRNVAKSVVIFGKLSKGIEPWPADLISKVLLNGVPSRTYSEHSCHADSRLPEYYVNQNDKLILLQPGRLLRTIPSEYEIVLLLHVPRISPDSYRALHQLRGLYVLYSIQCGRDLSKGHREQRAAQSNVSGT